VCDAAEQAIESDNPEMTFDMAKHPERVPMIDALAAQLKKYSTGKNGNRLRLFPVMRVDATYSDNRFFRKLPEKIPRRKQSGQ